MLPEKLFDSPLSRRQPTLFPAGARIGFVGDSLTRMGFYHRDLSLFYATRYPSRKLFTRSFGVSGNTAAGCVLRYDWDIAPFKAYVLTLCTGVNDACIWLYETDSPDEANLLAREMAFKGHEANTRKFIRMAKDNGSQVIVVSPALYDQTAEMAAPKRTGVNDVLRRMMDSDRKTAESLGCPFIDINTPMMKINEWMQQRNPQYTLVGPDRVHPKEVGHLVMAVAILKAQGVTPIVAEVSLDTRAQEHAMTRNSSISDLRLETDGASFNYLAGSLPFPLTRDQSPIAEFFDFQNEMNGEIIRVANLPSGRYILSIDGKPVSTISSRQLAKGINLSTLRTPQLRQANLVRKLIEKRHLLGQKLLIRSLLKQQFFPDKDSLSWKEESTILKAALEKLGTNTVWDRFRANNIREYLPIGARRSLLEEKYSSMSDEIYNINRPVTHLIEIQRII
ncbi:MAG: SGNH/GDSL hydrolase family protein [Victivallales bacterium]|nr:SGNH/GDSL hydrolase family protein [Victivallales bacterium]